MTEPIRLLSVIHTGTHFMQKLFSDAGIEQVSHRHYGKNFRPELINELIVSPIRDPWASYVTAYSRQTLDDNWWGGWHEFNWRYTLEPDLWIVPVDHTEWRDACLNHLMLRLMHPLETDWQPVRSASHAKHIKPADLSEIYNLPVVKAYYTDPNLNNKT